MNKTLSERIGSKQLKEFKENKIIIDSKFRRKLKEIIRNHKILSLRKSNLWRQGNK